MQVEIPETKVLLADMTLRMSGEPDETNPFAGALLRGKKFKDEGLTPFYVFDESSFSLIVTSKENMENKLH